MELLSYGWLTEYMVHINSPYKETMYGNFHECKTRSHDNAGQQYKRPETRNYIQLVKFIKFMHANFYKQQRQNYKMSIFVQNSN
jgi:hypothetical protein